MSDDQEIKQKPKATLIKHKKEEPVEADTEQDKGDKKKVVVVKKKVVVKRPLNLKVVSVKDDQIKTSEIEAPEEHEIEAAGKVEAPVQEVPVSSGHEEPVVTVPEEPHREETPVEKKAEAEPPEVKETLKHQADSFPNQRSQGSGYQGRPQQGTAGSGYQRGSGYQGRPQGGGYQGRPQQGTAGSGYQRGSGYQGRPQQGTAGSGYQRGSGYQGRPQGGGYQAGAGSRPPQNRVFKGKPGTTERPPFQRPGTGARTGGFRKSGENPIPAETKTGNKKFFKAKKKPAYQKSKFEIEKEEKAFQVKKKSTQMVNPVPKEIDILDVITVSELARKMNLKASELIGKLMSMGMMVTINQQIDAATAEIIAAEYGCKVNIVSLYDETIIEREDEKPEDLLPRPPIVTVMGHVDHGKTKLLDAIRATDVAGQEFGGITQHIGAYQVELEEGGTITFLDTPGHEAFTLMRARGAQVTDIVVLVVAANDGVMPQTVEAINHARDAKVPIIVAINKIDLPDANPERVKQQLSEYDLVPEAWGGSTLYNEISALKRQGIKELLNSILLLAEMLDLKASYTCRAEGKIIDTRVDHGRGIVSTVIIQRGTLSVGDNFVAGVYPGKVRAMFNDKGKKITVATPSMPVEVVGFEGIPNAGAPFQVTENEKLARQIGVKRQELERQGEAKNVKKVTLDNLYDSIQEGEIQELKVIIKGDVNGSVEALQAALERLSTKEIRLNVIHASAGAIVENDVNFAAASNAIIVGFHVRPTPKAALLAEQEKVEIRKYNIIYDAVEDIRTAMEGLLAPEIKEETIGTVEVRNIFKVPKIGSIAGCYVLTGKVKRSAMVNVIRDGVVIHSGKITSLKRFKDDVKEVDAGFECGIGIEGFNDFTVGDQLEIIEMKEIAKKLSSGNTDGQ